MKGRERETLNRKENRSQDKRNGLEEKDAAMTTKKAEEAKCKKSKRPKIFQKQ